MNFSDYEDGEKKTSKMMEIVTIKTSKSGGSEFGKMKIPLNQNAGGIGQLSPLVPTQKGIFFRETPSSYNFDWHVAPRKQFIINLDAPVQVEVTDGTKKILKAGEVFFVEDTEGTGHKSTSPDETIRHSVFIPISDEDYQKIQSGDFN